MASSLRLLLPHAAVYPWLDMIVSSSISDGYAPSWSGLLCLGSVAIAGTDIVFVGRSGTPLPLQ
ncbi:uncharacterized protein L969DRAFT_94798 [Mixia osmundae IAM 14324]|uniref:Uncharacterized protein n=1 Tax=Mixia osmundae (strain CBS 9802 / IAM 14324 / JCM 22182 / KY 12970) TaxID=764103 RepID=G7E498_MIXOS|nr:uncharacterized protein L969DRAFT_94798 [Mixia osmundae IAM 14324]KEI39756.1 hypothetical protein L969DRAFT_94798 [Mixia osmundae IAM 14324]GAA97658.1 hypothetical protein E5Q_04336 [Mixia osmundae IAM 14324]